MRSQTGNRQVGFLTNRHVAVDLDYPNQKMFHPLPPTLGPGIYLGAVERATSFITDELWYGIFAGINPGKVFQITGLIPVLHSSGGLVSAFILCFVLLKPIFSMCWTWFLNAFFIAAFLNLVEGKIFLKQVLRVVVIFLQ